MMMNPIIPTFTTSFLIFRRVYFYFIRIIRRINSPIPLQMFADGNSLLDQEIQVLRNVRGQSLRFQDTKDLASCHESDLCHSVRVSEDATCTRTNHNLINQYHKLPFNQPRSLK
jgi:hypothetical protein